MSKKALVVILQNENGVIESYYNIPDNLIPFVITLLEKIKTIHLEKYEVIKGEIKGVRQ